MTDGWKDGQSKNNMSPLERGRHNLCVLLYMCVLSRAACVPSFIIMNTWNKFLHDDAADNDDTNLTFTSIIKQAKMWMKLSV